MAITLTDLVQKLVNVNPSKRVVIDEESTSRTYVGFTSTDTALESEPKWRIARILRSGHVFRIDFANDGIFNAVWDDRATYFSAGVLANDYSLFLDGVNDYADFGDYYGFEHSLPFSWSFWIRPAVVNAAKCLLVKCNGSADVQGYGFQYTASGQPYAQMRASGSGVTSIVFTDLALQAGVWQHLVFTYAGASNLNGFCCYLNGAKSSIVSGNFPQIGTIVNPTNLIFGLYRTTLYPYAGHMDEPCVFDKTLTQAEVTEIYNGGVPKDMNYFSAFDNLKSWWRFGDGDVAPIILDQKSNVNGTIVNGGYFAGEVP